MDFGEVLKYVIQQIFIPLCNWTPTFFGIPLNLPMVLCFSGICWCLGMIFRILLYLWVTDY